MALTKNARNKLFKLVQQSKRLLYQEIIDQLQQHYGIFADSGKVLSVEELTTSEADVIHKAKLLRDRLKYLSSNLADKKNEAVESIEQLIREQAFTILNRLAALRMAEERGIVRETISKGYTSEGFQVYDSITGQGSTASTFIRYKWYLNAVFDELALDLPSIFDRFSPYAIIFPSEKSLIEMLDLINDEELIIHREEGYQPINLWQQDETIGWIYQYYNGREEISVMREASTAPRNSQELAVRNQFFTPRYVVQFLTDNTLGKIWYEMTKGNTVLKDVCPYLIKHPKELFLNKGEITPLKPESDVNYIEHREIKDPREIKLLDPACGSMHFGLYAFDLMEIIYQEAWDNHKELLTDLKNSITRAEFMNQVPELIIRHNIHGVDIDPRALQIAALSLWLRAQKSFDKLKLEPSKRPQIKKSNLVLAEPMPVNQEFLNELIKPLDEPMRKLVIRIWDLMKLTGEAGLLLRIENEIDNSIQEIVRDLASESLNSQIKIGASEEQLLAAEKSAHYATKKYRNEFLDNAEKQVLEILKSLAENSDNSKAYQKLLFADDSERGFAFIELCRNRYDVIVMNPPFGASTNSTNNYFSNNYPYSKYDLASCFIERSFELLNSNGLIGSITTRAIYFLGSFSNWRKKLVFNHINYFIDLGSEVLDAMVETSACVYSARQNMSPTYFRLTKQKEKQKALEFIISSNNTKRIDVYHTASEVFNSISNTPLCYWIDDKTYSLFKTTKKFKTEEDGAFAGLATTDNFRFTINFWEQKLPKYSYEYGNGKWHGFIIGDGSTRFYVELGQVVNWQNNGYEIKNHILSKGISITKRVVGEAIYFLPGISWPYRTAYFKPHFIPKGYILSSSRYLAVQKKLDDLYTTVGLWNSQYFDYCIKLSMEADSGNPKFINGTVNQLPNPTLPDHLKVRLRELTISQFNLVKEIYRTDPVSISFSSNILFKDSALSTSVDSYIKLLSIKKSNYLDNLNYLNKIVYDHFDIDVMEQQVIKDIVIKSGSEDEGKIFDIDKNELFFRVIDCMFGCMYLRWDLRILKQWQDDWNEADISIERKHSPFLYGQEKSIMHLAKQEYHQEIKDLLSSQYPIFPLKEIADIEEITTKFIEVARFFWSSLDSNIEFEIQDYFSVNQLKEIFSNPGKYFDLHLKEYSRNKRISPIYWPLSSLEGNYTIWLYYPNLNDQTLISAINNYLQPKIDSVIESIRQFSNNPNLDNKGLKELKYLQDFLHELEDMKKEIISITSLPYKPNHDDGVLITAAPLYKLFRHAKWRKSTEECWKALEKGEYDWAHLAYSIWPDRVTKKCKKDFSLAIAHGLEEICENKPKEKKEKVKKESKENKKNLKLNLE